MCVACFVFFLWNWVSDYQLTYSIVYVLLAQLKSNLRTRYCDRRLRLVLTRHCNVIDLLVLALLDLQLPAQEILFKTAVRA